MTEPLPMTEPDDRQRLFNAITAGDAQALCELLMSKPGLAASRDDRGVSALMIALYHRQLEAVTRLRERLDSVDLFEAAALGEIDRMRELLRDEPASARAVSPDGGTALHFACFFGREDIARELLKHDADLNAVAPAFGRVQPLHSAAASGNTNIVTALLEAGADVNATQAGGFTALHAAAMHQNLDMTRVLLMHGANPQQAADDGRTAQDMARETDNAELIALLEQPPG